MTDAPKPTPTPTPYSVADMGDTAAVIDGPDGRIVVSHRNAREVMNIAYERGRADGAREERERQEMKRWEHTMGFCLEMADAFAKDGKPASAATIRSAVKRAREEVAAAIRDRERGGTK
jgi:hypothetical protein